MNVSRVTHIESWVSVETVDVHTSARGWAEASTYNVDVEAHDPKHVIVHSDELPDILVSRELLEAALELLDEEG